MLVDVGDHQCSTFDHFFFAVVGVAFGFAIWGFDPNYPGFGAASIFGIIGFGAFAFLNIGLGIQSIVQNRRRGKHA